MKSLTDKQQLLLETLRKDYPLAFPETPVPLKSGILDDMKATIHNFGGNCIKKLIIYYCRQEQYLQVIANAEPGTPRVALDGTAETTVTEAHITYSRKKLARLRQRLLKTNKPVDNIKQLPINNRKILSLKPTTYNPQPLSSNNTLSSNNISLPLAPENQVTLSDT